MKMSKQIILSLSFFLVLPMLWAKPVTVTKTKMGGLIRTERHTNPSNCLTIGKFVCGTDKTKECYTITYTYDDGTHAFGSGLEEGPIDPPIEAEVLNAEHNIQVAGSLSHYQEYSNIDPVEGLVSIYEFAFNICN
jgi:hypothetical protein